jgi:hypothetical protein
MVKAENHTHLNILFLTIVLTSMSNFLFAHISGVQRFDNDTVKLYTPIADSAFQSTMFQDSLTVTDTLSVKNHTLSVKNDTLVVATTPETPSEKIVQIDFNVNAKINYISVCQFRTENGKDNFLKGMASSRRLDSLISLTTNLRADYQNALTNSEKETIGERVMKLEIELIEIKVEADNYLNNAREFEIGFWKETQELDYRKYITESDSIADLIRKQNEPKPAEIKPVEIEEQVETADTLSLATQVPAEQVKNEQVVYKIQIGNYNTKLPAAVDKLFKKIGTLRKIDTYLDEKGSTVYTIGELSKLSDAAKLQNQIRQEGVKDAFIIAIYNGKRITLNEAKVIK